GARGARGPGARSALPAAKARVPARPPLPHARAAPLLPASARLRSTMSALPSCPVQSSRPPFADQILDLEATKSDATARLEEPGDGTPSLCPIEVRTGRHQLGHRLAAPGDDDLLAALHLIQQGAEPVLRLECSDLTHRARKLVYRPAYRSDTSLSTAQCSALRRSSVPSSSAPVSREYPATSAARIAARGRDGLRSENAMAA